MSNVITTRPFELQQKVYLKIIFRTRLQRFWLLYVLIILMPIPFLKDFGENWISTFLVLFGFSYPLITFFYLYYWSTSKWSSSLFGKRTLTFNEEHVEIKTEGATEGKVTYSDILRIVETRTFFLLYVSKDQFIYILKSSFKSESDLFLFQERITSQLEKAI